MPLFIVDITKEFTLNGQTWGNRYIVEADTIGDAGGAGVLIRDQEKRFHSTDVTITRQRVASLEADNPDYVTTPLSIACLTGPPSSPVVPIQTVVRVDISRTGHGRPDRKFYHVCVGVEQIDDVQVWEAAYVTTIDGVMSDMITDCTDNGTPLCDTHGNLWVLATTFAKFGYHQFTKASKRALP